MRRLMVLLFVLLMLPVETLAEDSLLKLDSPPPADARASFLKVMKTPTILLLREFEKFCGSSKSPIDFENDQSVFDQLTELKKLPEIVKMRVLMYSAAHCATEKSRNNLLTLLGVDLLDEKPVLVIRALVLEGLTDELAPSMAVAEPAEFAGAACQTLECKTRRRQALETKRRALETAKVRKNEEPARTKLLEGVKSQ